MNIKEYIESGTLEAFVLGALSPDEEAQVQAYVALYPELSAEVVAIEAAMFRYAEAGAMAPSPALQDKIWNSLQASMVNKAPTAAGDDQPKTAKVIPIAPPRHMRFSYAAVWAALIGSVALNTFFWSQHNDQKQLVADQSAKMEKMSNEQKILTALVDNYRKGKDMMADTAMQTIVMHTVQPGHPMAATLYWSKGQGSAYVMIDALPEPPKGMQYQLWVMQGGKPVDMGVIPIEMANTPSIQKVNMKVTDGQAFAISLEKVGGSPTPTMQNIYVMGKA